MAFTVLVLDAKQRSALAVTRALGKLTGVKVITAEAGEKALAGCSRYSSSYLSSPDAEHQPGLYLEWLKETLAKQHYDLVVPVTEITSQLLLMNKDDFPWLPIPFADYETVMRIADKGALLELAQKLGVRAPRSWRLSSAAELDTETIEYPIVIKPCVSRIYTGSGWVATRVKVVYSKEDLLDELCQSDYLQTSPFLLQEFIPGHGAGVFCLFDQGQPRAFFAHRRLREKPPQGGVSVLSESVAVDPVLKEYACKLLEAVKWHGVAMVEFRIDAQGVAYLMEVNTRFWGSLQLAIDAGVDFPTMLFQQELVPDEVALESKYREGQRLRWLLGDLDSLYIYLKGKYSGTEKLKRVIQFLTPNMRSCRHEIDRWDDMGPARHELRLYFKQLLGR